MPTPEAIARIAAWADAQEERGPRALRMPGTAYVSDPSVMPGVRVFPSERVPEHEVWMVEGGRVAFKIVDVGLDELSPGPRP